jgi:hypothetical protein
MATRRFRAAIGIAAVLAPLTVAAASVFADDSTSEGFARTLEHICEGQNGIVANTTHHLSCTNVTPSPYRSTVMQVVDHVCTELLGATLSAGPTFGASDGSVISWTCGPLQLWRAAF